MDRTTYIANSILRLVEYQKCDDIALYENWLDPDTQRGYNFILKEPFEKFSKKEIKQRFLAMIQLNETNELIGYVGISPPETTPDLAIWLFKPFRRKGYGTSAFALAIQYAVDVLKITELHAGAYPDNIGSQKMLKKCGYILYPEGNLHEKHYLTGDDLIQLDYIYKGAKTKMNLMIKPLTHELTADYLDFFDNRAFSDDNPCGPCYCTGANMDAEVEQQMVSEFENDVKGTLRRYAVKLLAEEKIHGYLAFDGDKSIGWCNAGDMDGYISFKWIPEAVRQNKCGKTMSVVCFAIAPEYRGKGVSTALLERVCADAKALGFAAVEGYARVQKDRVYYDYNGPIRLYEKAGFANAAQQDEVVIMRKVLRIAP